MQRNNDDSIFEIMVKMPIADEVKIVSGDKLEFYFSSKHRVEQFANVFHINYKINAPVSGLQVALTEEQIDHWLGVGSFKRLQQYDGIKVYGQDKIKYFQSLSDNLLHIAVLFKIDKKRNGFYLALNEISEDCLADFLSRFSYNMLTHLCLLPNASGAIGLYDAFNLHNNNRIFIALIKCFTPQTCRSISRLEFSKHSNIFDLLSSKPDIYILFTSKLLPCMLNDAWDNAFESVLKMINNSDYDQYHSQLLLYINAITPKNWGAALLKSRPNQIRSSWQNVVFLRKYGRHIVERLCLDTCNSLALTKLSENSNEVGLSMAAAYMQIDAFMIFMRKLSTETCDTVINIKDSDKKRLIDVIALRGFSISQLTEIVNKFSLEPLLDALFSFRSNHSLLDSKNNINNIHNIILGRLFRDSKALKSFRMKYPQLQSIKFRDNGSSHDLWSKCTSWMLKALPDIDNVKTYASPVYDIANHESATTNSIDLAHEIGDLKFLRIQGRTVLFEDMTGKIIAYKVQKANEDPKELSNEFDINYSLQNTDSLDGTDPKIPMFEALDIKSKLALPLSLNYMTGIYDFLQSLLSTAELISFKEMTYQGESNIHYVYKYSIAPENIGYFTYLHSTELSDAEFSKANSIIIKDLLTFLMALRILFPESADIFHNLDNIDERDDKGRYLVLINALLNVLGGSGRISRWRKAVEFPNFRATGLADLGDIALLSDYLTTSPISNKHFSGVYSEHRRKAGNVITANFIAEYQYILFLNAGLRASKLTHIVERSNLPAKNKIEKIASIWKIVARQVMMNAIQAVSIITHQSQGEISRILTSIIDVEVLARQMQYWMTTDYITNIKNNFIPAWVYGPSVSVTVDFKKFRHNTFNDLVGCSIDGVNQDLGPVNGQEPIKEANKLFYWMTTLILNFYSQIAMAFKQLVRLSEIKNPDISQIIRLTLFSYLPAKQENLLQIELCKQLLANAALSTNSKAKIKNELEDRMKMKAAYIFLSLFRNVKYKKEFGLKINRFGMFGRSAPARTSTAAAAAGCPASRDMPSSPSFKKE